MREEGEREGERGHEHTLGGQGLNVHEMLLTATFTCIIKNNCLRTAS